MNPFTYSRAADPAAAIRDAAQAGAKYLGGGTNLVDLMREGVERPSALVDVTGLDRTASPSCADGGLRIGAATSNTALAADRRVRTRYPMLTRAIVAGASAQIRNMATRGRQPAAAHALPLLLRRRRALQQARAGRGLRRAGRLQSHACDPGRIRCLRGDASVRHVRGAGGAGRDGASRAAPTAARVPALRGAAPPARRHARRARPSSGRAS